MPEERELKTLPQATNSEMSAAVTLMGGVLFNVILFHLMHFPETARQDRATRVIEAARDAVQQLSLNGGTDEERMNVRALIDAVLAQVEGYVRDELVRRKDDDGSVKH